MKNLSMMVFMKGTTIPCISKSSMVKEGWLFLQADRTLATLAGTKWMDGVNSSILLVDLLLRGIGRPANSMDMVNYLTRLLCMLRLSITAISTKFRKKMMAIGRFMKVGWRMTWNKGKEYGYWRMEKNIKVSFIKIR